MMLDNVTGKQELEEQAMAFAVAVVRMYNSLPNSVEARDLGRQALKSGTIPGAHFREATAATSEGEFIAKASGAVQKLEETGYWMELLTRSGLVTQMRMNGLMQDCRELIARLSKSIKVAEMNVLYRGGNGSNARRQSCIQQVA